MFRRIRCALKRSKLHVWYDESYRCPMTALELLTGLQSRRADFAFWHLLDTRALHVRRVHVPTPITWHELSRIHTQPYLESLDEPGTLARIFGIDLDEVPVETILHMLRVACGATRDAARLALERSCHGLNLLGGFHHAEPDKGGGLCAVNDIAVAIASVRSEGFRGSVVVLDLDAHPPDGLSACLPLLQNVWIGSISAVDWGPLPGVDETLLPPGSSDVLYMQALEKLLRRVPPAELAFVIAGGDVLAVDPMGGFGLTERGARLRDRAVARTLQNTPTVWVPGGGYSPGAWRVLAGTGLAVALDSVKPIPANAKPMARHFARLSKSIHAREDRTEEAFAQLTEEDLFGDLGRVQSPRRFLGHYTTQGIEYALSRFGLLGYLRRLGFNDFRVHFQNHPTGQLLQLFAHDLGREILLIETMVEIVSLDDDLRGLYIHWLTMRNPRARFSPIRPQLPGQDAPGLGLSLEMMTLFQHAALRVKLDAILFRPSYVHTAIPGRSSFVFEDPERQGRFLALLRDGAHLSVPDLSQALHDGRVFLNGEPYTWEADRMVSWLDEKYFFGSQWHARCETTSEHSVFTFQDP